MRRTITSVVPGRSLWPSAVIGPRNMIPKGHGNIRRVYKPFHATTSARCDGTGLPQQRPPRLNCGWSHLPETTAVDLADQSLEEIV